MFFFSHRERPDGSEAAREHGRAQAARQRAAHGHARLPEHGPRDVARRGVFRDRKHAVGTQGDAGDVAPRAGVDGDVCGALEQQVGVVGAEEEARARAPRRQVRDADPRVRKALVEQKDARRARGAEVHLVGADVLQYQVGRSHHRRGVEGLRLDRALDDERAARR